MNRKISIKQITIFFCVYSSFCVFAQEVRVEDLTSPFVDEMISSIKTEGKVPKKSLAILEIESGKKFQRNISLDLTDILITELRKTNKFELIERNKLEQIIKEQNLKLAGFVDESKAVEVGKLTGARYMVFGSITSATETKIDKFAYYNIHIEVGIDIRIVDTETGKIIFTESAIGQNDNKVIVSSKGEIISGNIDYNVAYTKAARIAVKLVAIKVGNITPVLGIIISSNENEVMIDLGKNNLITLNQEFLVFRVINEIVHPITKKNLGFEKKIIGKIIISQIDNNFSKAEIDNLENSETIKIGDFVFSQNKNIED